MRDDVRDLRGRLRRLVCATVLGAIIALSIALALPTRDHFPLPPGSCGNEHWSQGWLVEGGDPVLMAVGGIVVANFAYVVLLWRAKRRSLLPIARLLR